MPYTNVFTELQSFNMCSDDVQTHMVCRILAQQSQDSHPIHRRAHIRKGLQDRVLSGLAFLLGRGLSEGTGEVRHPAAKVKLGGKEW